MLKRQPAFLINFCRSSLVAGLRVVGCCVESIGCHSDEAAAHWLRQSLVGEVRIQLD